MPVDTLHPEYQHMSERWRDMHYALSDERTVRAAGERYLPKTGGMRVNDTEGNQYRAYAGRARWVDITTQALTGIMGLLFTDEPEGITDEPVTNTQQSNGELARELIRALATKGRHVLLIDAPTAESGGGSPFIATYSAESLINWKTDPADPSQLSLAVLHERVPDELENDLYEHTMIDQYRVYEMTTGGYPSRSIYRRQGNGGPIELVDTRVLSVPFMPLIVAGAVDLTPAVDPIPLLPVAQCAFAFFQISADYRQALHRNGQPTAWVSGVGNEQYQALIAQGLGSGSLWYLGLEGQAGYLETTGQSLPEHREALQEELDRAQTYAVRLVQSDDTPESGVALQQKAAAQHASLYTMADSASMAITRAQEMRAQWGGLSAPDEFVISTAIDTTAATDTMITAVNQAIMSGNAPRSSLFELLRKSGSTTLTDEAIEAEIASTGALPGVKLGVDPVAVDDDGGASGQKKAA